MSSQTTPLLSFRTRAVSWPFARLLAPWTPDLLAILALLAPLPILFRGALLKGLIFYERDTLVFYHPVLVETARALRQGSLPLWTSNIFGGFPLFADGEGGTLYPLNLLLLLLTSPEGALLWLGPLRLAMAGLFMYLYIRTIGLGSLGALISALVFALGGFTIAQLHHLNLSNGAIWLPLILLFVERAYRGRGMGRLWGVALAGLFFGLQSLALHVQVTVMTTLILGLYVAFRSVALPLGSLLGRLGMMVGALGGTIGLGLGLAAVQWLPLYELAQFSARGQGLPYRAATEYSLPPVNLITLLFPYFFRGAERVSWALWSSWETAIYVGIAPLLLAAVAVIGARSRWAFFFAFVALLSLAIALAGYLPLNLHYLLYQLPWLDVLRAPARFSYLFTFSMAGLAGIGAHWLSSKVKAPPGRPVWALAPLAALPLLAALLYLMQWLRGWLLDNPSLALERIQDFYLNLGPLENLALGRAEVYNYLKSALSLDSPQLWVPFALMVAVALLLSAWLWRPQGARVWQAGLAFLVALDLLWFAQNLHPTTPVAELAQPNLAEAYLVGRDRQAAEKEGLARTFSWRGSPTEPNRLLAFQVPEARGYSSLRLGRHAEYVATTYTGENRLLDLWNVRYLSVRGRPTPLPSFEGTSFDPGWPLFNSTSRNPGARLTFRVPQVPAEALGMVSNLRRATHIPQGTQVGNIALLDTEGRRWSLPLLAGLHTAEAAYDREDVRPWIKHDKPTVAQAAPERGPAGRPYTSYLYFVRVPLPQTATIQELRLEYTYPTGKLQVFGLGLYRARAGRAYQVRPVDQAKYQLAYQDDEVAVYENRAVLPRAFLVPRAMVLPPGNAILSRMAEGEFDPQREVILEETVPYLGEGSSADLGWAAIREYSDQKVVIEARAERQAFLLLSDSYYPGWRAYIDGQEVPVYRVNYLFRAVLLPGGSHRVEFLYQPASFAWGTAVSLFFAALLVALGAVGLSRRFRRSHR